MATCLLVNLPKTLNVPESSQVLSVPPLRTLLEHWMQAAFKNAPCPSRFANVLTSSIAQPGSAGRSSTHGSFHRP